MSTRIIGAIIMTHGDDNGLKLPPYIAPTQLMIIPIAMHKEGVKEKALELKNKLSGLCRTGIDVSDQSPGWKFAQYEMKGVPLRLEIGPRDIENNQCVLVRRDNREKIVVGLDELETTIPKLLQAMHDAMLLAAQQRRETMTYEATSLEEIKDIADNKPGFIKAMWCGSLECEMKLKEYAGITSRCMPFTDEKLSDKCVCCEKDAEALVFWGKAY